jgi:betaine-aldehyde dehydrogenase
VNEQSLLIGGEWRKPAGSDAVDVINPSTGQRLRSAPLAIAAACGQQLKRSVLELGGKSAAIVLDDADLDLVTRTMIGAAYNNTGQACNALTRLVVPAALYDTVVDAVCDAARQLRIGDASDEATQIGPIATQRQLDRVNGLVDRAVQDGAKVATGGRRPDGLPQGWFIEPTVLTNVVTA